jgi:hypothetical protein
MRLNIVISREGAGTDRVFPFLIDGFGNIKNIYCKLEKHENHF